MRFIANKYFNKLLVQFISFLYISIPLDVSIQHAEIYFD